MIKKQSEIIKERRKNSVMLLRRKKGRMNEIYHQVICPVCKTPFWTKYKNQKYCSKKCLTFYHNKYKKVKKICKWCGGEFLTHLRMSVFCSVICRKEFKKVKKIEKRCANCKNVFFTRQFGKKYCSVECSRETQMKRYESAEKIRLKNGVGYLQRKKVVIKEKNKDKGLMNNTSYNASNEQEIVFLFGKFHKELGFPTIKRVRTPFPDCIAINNKEEEKKIEFEYFASNFKIHLHDVEKCNMIICWKNDWKTCPIEVIELSSWLKEVKKWTK